MANMGSSPTFAAATQPRRPHRHRAAVDWGRRLRWLLFSMLVAALSFVAGRQSLRLQIRRCVAESEERLSLYLKEAMEGGEGEEEVGLRHPVRWEAAALKSSGLTQLRPPPVSSLSLGHDGYIVAPFQVGADFALSIRTL